MSAKLSSSHVSRAKKASSLKPTLKSPKCTIKSLLVRSFGRRVSRYFIIPVVAFWALLHISQFLLPPIACSRHLHNLRPRLGSARRPPTDELWNWALSTSDEPQLSPCVDLRRDANLHNLSNPPETSKRKKYYMMAVVSGGLNQQRNQIVDAVVVARILGAALVVPVFQVNQVWGDDSEFADIFDVEHFKQTLRGDVKILSSLPSTHIRHRKVNAPKMQFDAGEDWVRQN